MWIECNALSRTKLYHYHNMTTENSNHVSASIYTYAVDKHGLLLEVISNSFQTLSIRQCPLGIVRKSIRLPIVFPRVRLSHTPYRIFVSSIKYAGLLFFKLLKPIRSNFYYRGKSVLLALVTTNLTVTGHV